MGTDLLELMSGDLEQHLLVRAGSVLVTSESNARNAAGAVLAALLGRLMQKASIPASASELMTLLETPGLEAALSGDAGSNAEKTRGLHSLGGGLLASLFGDRLCELVRTIASAYNLKWPEVANLMALAAPKVLAYLRRYVNENRLGAEGLAKMLANQSEFLKRRIDSRTAASLGFVTPTLFLSSIGSAQGSPTKPQGRAELARKAQDYLEANLDQPFNLRDLSEITRCSERLLQYAFHEVYGMGPQAWFQAMKLSEAHRELRARGPGDIRVSDVALRWGFTHFGRFSVPAHVRGAPQRDPQEQGTGRKQPWRVAAREDVSSR